MKTRRKNPGVWYALTLTIAGLIGSIKVWAQDGAAGAPR